VQYSVKDAKVFPPSQWEGSFYIFLKDTQACGDGLGGYEFIIYMAVFKPYKRRIGS